MLEFLLEGSIPKRISVRVKNSGFVHYGIGDASGNGYRAAIHIGGNLHFRYSQCSSRESEETSNYREFSDLVNCVEKLYGEGHLKDCELFSHTNNLVTDCTYYKGSSSSRTLFLLILRLRKVQMAGDMILHVNHISGKRMITSGIDGLSRGVTNEGVMKGIQIRDYLPMYLSVVDRSSKLIPWIRPWWLQDEVLEYY